MASMTPKMLGEILQEQQEPFTLEIYLLERGYPKNKFNSSRSFGCCSSNSTNFLNRSASCCLYNRRRVVSNCSKIVKAMFNKLLSTDSKLTEKKNGRKKIATVKEMIINSQAIKEKDKFSSGSSKTVLNSCSDIEVHDAYDLSEKEVSPKTCHANLGEEVAATHREFQWEEIKDNKQLSPVSVLEEIQINEARQNAQEGTSTTYKKLADESIFSVSRFQLSFQSVPNEPNHNRAGKLQQILVSDPSSRYINNKRALQQSKQLLFDCLREVVDNRTRKDKRSLQFQEIPGPDEIRKLLCRNIMAWSRNFIDETQKIYPRSLDLLASAEALIDFEQQIKEIGMEIGDAILEDINNEIVTDMIKCVQQNTF